ncbi:hypothetical protein JEQ12_001649 [Ovis aries]|uniref:RING-type E3 ubiquitin transferase n=1 Tax=Ovis aries TaxID=9940 RepID=A0A836AK00_SHEEP|nr:hypothetical protein JEQ12_001649 [Ovis aries]
MSGKGVWETERAVAEAAHLILCRHIAFLHLQAQLPAAALAFRAGCGPPPAPTGPMHRTCVHPVSLPCKHVFCYLCVKGASWLGKRCALCRQEIPEDFLDKPTSLSPGELKAASGGNGDYAWYYEGRNGWWQNDERTSRELEDAFSKGKKSTEMLIAGFLYVADLENMVQYRRNEHGRRRKIKRDIIDIPKKGVAGLRLDCDANTVNLARESSADGADSVPAQSGASVQSSSVRPLTSVDGQLTSPATPSPDASASLEDSFAHLQLGGDSIAERSHRGEGEEEHESPSSGRVPAPDTSIEETESDASSDSEDVSALVAQHSLTQQRLLVPNPNQTVSDRSGTDRSVAAGGTGAAASGEPEDSGWLQDAEPSSRLLSQAARAALHFFNFRAASPSALQVLANVLDGRAPQSMEGCGVESSYATQGTLDKPASDHLGLSLTVRQVNQKKEYKFDLVFTTEFYRAEEGEKRLGTCSAQVFFRNDKPRPAVNVTCTQLIKKERRQEEDYQLYKLMKQLKSPLNAVRIPDSHGYIAPSLRPIWNLAFLGSSYVMWQKTTPFLHYFMSQISSVKQWKTNDDAIDFDYTVLLHEFSTQEIIPCRIHLVWYPGKPLKVKYHCQERQTPEEGSGTEEGSAVALTELSNF